MKLLVLLALTQTALAANLERYPGWHIDPPVDDQTYSQKYYTLTPPPPRPAKNILANLAERVIRGELSPEAAYGEKVSQEKIAETKSDRNVSPNAINTIPNTAEIGGPSPSDPGVLPSQVVVASPLTVAPSSGPDSTWNPDGTAFPRHADEDTSIACGGTEAIGWDKPQTWDLPKSSQDGACSAKDMEERVRRDAYLVCNSEHAKKIGSPDPGSGKIAWHSEPQEWKVKGHTYTLGQGLYFCNDGRAHRVTTVLREYKKQCWACGRGTSFESEPDMVAAKKYLLKSDLKASRRTSPHESESVDENDSYWTR